MWIWIGGDGRIFISVSLLCISLLFFNDFIFHIFLLLTWNAKLEALTFPLSGTGGISLLGSQECAPEQKRLQPNPFCIIQLQYYKKKCRSEQIACWASKAHS